MTGLPLTGGANRNTGATPTFFASKLNGITGKGSLDAFLEYIVARLTDYGSADAWFADYFGSRNLFYEKAISGHSDVEYRAWSILKAGHKELILPALTLPEKCAYLIASPTQVQFGSLYTYSRDPAADYENLRTRVQNYGDRINTFYTTAAGFIEAKYFNGMCKLSIDTCSAYADGTWTWNRPGTSSPFHKYFTEATGLWAASNGSAAYSNGYAIYWVCYSALGSLDDWSHETAHMEDGSVFLKRYGRRARGWAEDYADGNIAQGFGDGGVNFNLSYTYDRSANVITNLTPDRINSEEKINSYYKRMFEASDMLDYLEALAFLQLTPAEQAMVAVQVTPYTVNGDAMQNGTRWKTLTAAEFEAMNLETVADLWDNRITIKPGVSGTASAGVNSYGGESIYTRRWYFPYNDSGRPDSNSFKYNAWAMLGEGGYDGYVSYFSGKYSNDLAALKAITGCASYRDYRLSRYAKMESLKDSMTWLDADTVVNQYLEALRYDATHGDRSITCGTNIKRMNYYYLKRATNDFETDIFTSHTVTHIKTAYEFVTLLQSDPYGDFVLDNDIDLSEVNDENYDYYYSIIAGSIVPGTFRGRLDGNGYKVYNTEYPLFQALNCAYVQNLTFSGTHRTTICDSITLSYVDVTIDQQVILIETAEQFAAMANQPAENYRLAADIDFSDYTAPTGRVVTGTFTGYLDGSGHTLRNLKNASLFETFSGNAHDFTLDGQTWEGDTSSADYVTAFAKTTSYASISNVSFKNISLSGRHYTAVVSGYENNSSVSHVSIENASVQGGNASTPGHYNSLLFGRIRIGTNIQNIFVRGDLDVHGTENGGVVGRIDTSAVINGAMVDCDLSYSAADGDSGNLSGCVVGNASAASFTVYYVVSIGQVTGNAYAFTGATGYLSRFDKCYEAACSGGISSANGSNVMTIAAEALTKDFYLNTFYLDEDWWQTDDAYSATGIAQIEGGYRVTISRRSDCIQAARLILSGYRADGTLAGCAIASIPYGYADSFSIDVSAEFTDAVYVETCILSDWESMLPSGEAYGISLAA